MDVIYRTQCIYDELCFKDHLLKIHTSRLKSSHDTIVKLVTLLEITY